MREQTFKKLNVLGTSPHFVEPHESFAPTKSGASAVEVGGSKEPAGKALGHPGGNLGKFLHPKKGGGYKPSNGKPASDINRTIDANTGGARVRATQ